MPASLEGSPFAGTASYYHRFRAPYAQASIDFIVERYNLGKGVRVLDLGCGPGTIAIPLSYTVREVVAVETRFSWVATRSISSAWAFLWYQSRINPSTGMKTPFNETVIQAS
jgi:predicted RNA methylase